ncbi:MAG: RNA polymerase sigma factor [Dehalococcoidia bacterium]
MDGSHTEDERRFDALWREHHRAVLAYALRRAPDQARDLAAEVFVVAWRRLDQVPDDALPWLLAVARNKVLNQRRGARRWIAALARLANERERHAPDPADASDLSRLRAALTALSERDREIIALTAWDGLSTGQAATVLGITPQAAAVRLHRARGRLRLALDPPDPASPGFTPAPAAKESPP